MAQMHQMSTKMRFLMPIYQYGVQNGLKGPQMGPKWPKIGLFIGEIPAQKGPKPAETHNMSGLSPPGAPRRAQTGHPIMNLDPPGSKTTQFGPILGHFGPKKGPI